MPPAAEAGPLLRPEPGPLKADGTRQRSLIGRGRRGRPLRFIAYAVMIVIGAAAVMLPSRASFALAIPAFADGRMSADMRQPSAIESALDALINEIGHDHVFNVVVTDDFVTVDAPLKPSAVESDHWMFRRGVATHNGATLIQPDVADEQFRLDEAAWPTLWSAMQTASEQVELGITDSDSFSVGREADSDINGTTFGKQVGPVAVRFSLANDYRDAFFMLDADGELVTSS